MADPTQPAYRHAGAILFVIAFSSFLATFNETILNVALNPLMAAFSVDSPTVQWTVTLNMLVIAVVIPIAGFLQRRLQTRTLVIGSLAVTLAGCAMGALATSFPMLLASRVVQAAGTGVTMPVTMALTLVIAPRNRLGTYMGIVSMLTTLGPSVGPIASGFVLAGTDDWHMLFVLLGALVLVCLVAAVVFVPNVAEPDRARLDFPSVALVTVALVGTMYGITELFHGGGAVGATSLVAGIAAFAGFAARQGRIADPLVDLSPFARGGFLVGVLMMMLAFMSTFAMNIVIPLYLQGALGESAFGAALVLLPATIFSAICSPIGGRIFDRFGVKALVPAAFILIMAGSFALGHIDLGTGTMLITLIFIPVVIGTAIGTSPSQSFALSRLAGPERPHGVTIVAVALQIAGCIGSSAFVGIMSAAENAGLAAGLRAFAAQTAAFDVTCSVVCAVGAVGLVLALVAGAKVSRRTPGWIEPDDRPAPRAR